MTCNDPDERTILVDCDCCGGDGRRITSRWEWEDTDLGPCLACDGAGQIEIELQPIEEADLYAECGLWECYEPEDNAYMEPDPEFVSVPCPTCKGHGVVNPLTAPKWFLCVTTTTCPECDGSGEF